jgi:hypothetical protein
MKKMKKILFVIGVCIILLSIPAISAFPTLNKSNPIFSPPKLAGGTFVGGLGRGHWGNGFHIDTVYADLSGVYTSAVAVKLTGEITDQDDEKLGEISAIMVSKIIFGYTENLDGAQVPIIVFLMRNRNKQFVGRIMFSMFVTIPHIWGYLIPSS